VVRPLVAGIDIGSAEHWVCGPARADATPNVRAFGTTTDELHALVEWLVAQGVESVAMESTSVYWIPVYELLASRGVEVVLVNARQLHYVPGRRTDVSDCQWLQLLPSCGLLRGSFRPADAIVRLRALQRQVANLVAERTRCVQWMQKALDQMNVQVHRAVADLTGTTGMAIVRAIVAGEHDPATLAAHRDPWCRKSADEIARYLTGTWRDEHLFTLASALRLYDAFETELATFETQLRAELAALEPPTRRAGPGPSEPRQGARPPSPGGASDPHRPLARRGRGSHAHRRDQYQGGPSRRDRSRAEPRGVSLRRRLRLLAPPLSAHADLRRQAPQEAAQWPRRQSWSRIGLFAVSAGALISSTSSSCSQAHANVVSRRSRSWSSVSEGRRTSMAYVRSSSLAVAYGIGPM
jgi:hypothetical protein